MIDKTALINSIAQKAGSVLGTGKSRTREDIENNIKALISSSLAKMELVTREEFDNQVAVLRNTRSKLAALEEQLKEMSSRQDTEE